MSSRFDSLMQRREARRAAEGQRQVDPRARIAQLQRYRKKAAPDVGEVERILALDVVEQHTPEEVEAFSREHMLAPAFGRGARFMATQSSALDSFITTGGGFFSIGCGFGKCACASTELIDRERGRISALDTGPLATPSMDEASGRILWQTGTAFESGHKPCVRLCLKGGQWVELSTDHPVFTGRGWVRAEDITEEDLVATPRRLPEPESPVEVSDDEVIMLAYLLADGGLTGNSAAFVDDCADTLAEVQQVADRLGWSWAVSDTKSRAKCVSLSKGVRPWIQKWGIGVKSVDKRLPGRLYNLPRRQVALFLNRFWACDGHVGKDALECTLASEGLIRDLRYLLLRLGVLCRVGYKAARCGGKSFDAWRLTICGSNVDSFLNEVGTPIGQDRRVARIRESRAGVRANTNTDIVPFGRPELAQVCDELDIPGRGGDRTNHRGPSRTELRAFLGCTAGQYVSRGRFEEFCARYNYEGRFAWLASSDLSWERVKSVEPIGVQPVYDLNVPGTESWIGNAVVLHNTGISLYAAELEHRRGTKKIMLLVPPQVYPQLVKQDIPFWSRMVSLSVPIHLLGGQPQGMRRRIYHSGRRGLYIVPYSLLSTKDSLDMLRGVDPDLVIADEAHNLKDKKTARTKRVWGWKAERDAQECSPRFVAMSGTITSKSLKDYHHLITWALGDGSPLPLPASLAESWAEVIDSGSTIQGEFQTGPLRPLVRWAAQNFSGETFRDTVSDFRRAFRLRLTTAPGVVSTGDAEVQASLIIGTADCPGPRETLVDLMAKVKEEYKTPNGDEIDFAIHTYKWLNELSAGFYNELVWPSPERVAGRTRMTEEAAAEAIDEAQEHHALQQLYHKELRAFLSDAPLGIDTPMEVARQINQHPDNMPFKLVNAYENMKVQEEHCLDSYGVLVEREGFVRRVDDYKIRTAVKWAKEQSGGCLLWYYHIGIGEWLAEAAEAAGLDVLHCPAGHNDEIIDHANAGRVVVASMSAHGTGKNLQHFQRQLFVQWPRDPKLAEQVLARTHRTGQEADELVAWRFDANGFDTINFAATLSDAVYVHQSTGQRQKLVYCTHSPLPRVFSPEFLREQGADPKILNEDQRAMMEDLFGADWRDEL